MYNIEGFSSDANIIHLIKSNFHKHCFFCIDFKNCAFKYEDTENSCKLMSCPINCGMIFHTCKKEEHLLLCQEQKVKCCNVENGCPVNIKRKLLSAHLKSCPASIIHCTMEWHRALQISDPSNLKGIHSHCLNCYNVKICAEELLPGFCCSIIKCPRHCDTMMHACKYAIHQFECPNENVTCLNPGCQHKCPRKFLKKHSLVCSKNIYQEDEFNVCSLYHLNKTFKKPPLDIALALRDLHLLKWLENNHISKRIAPDLWLYPKQIFTPKEEPCELLEAQNKDLTNIINNLSQVYKFKRLSEVRDKDDCPEKQMILKEVLNLVSENKKIETENDTSKAESINEPNEYVSSGGWIKLVSKNNSDQTENPWFCFTPNAFNCLLMYPTRYLGLKPFWEKHDRILRKNNEYTFFCSQVFRRDQYPSHYKNVHLDIQAGLNCGIQERCPLASYGCTFSRQSITPAPKGSEIVYNDNIESIGIKPFVDIQNQRVPQKVFLLDLPDEILEYIAKYLDGFNLINLLHTSKRLNGICRSLLMEQGIVQIKWARKQCNRTVKWQVVGKKWSFTSHFTPIRKWVFEEGNTIADHLKVCPFNNRLNRKSPWPILGPRDPMPALMSDRDFS